MERINMISIKISFNKRLMERINRINIKISSNKKYNMIKRINHKKNMILLNNKKQINIINRINIKISFNRKIIKIIGNNNFRIKSNKLILQKIIKESQINKYKRCNKIFNKTKNSNNKN